MSRSCIDRLDSEESILLLGRQFMGQFEQVTFDWERGRIRLGDAWVPIEATIAGGTPLFHAQTAVRDSRIAKLEASSARFDINPGLTPEQHEQLRQLVQDNEDFFASDQKWSSGTAMCEHAIDTGGAAPIKERPRRVPPQWKTEIERQLKEMLRNGVCRPSHSPWASNVVLVRKRDGNWRFANDYSKLNNVTKKDAYSLPNIQAILDRLGGSRYFSFIDIVTQTL